MSVFAAQRRGVFGAVAGDLPAAPMAVAGGTMCRVVVIAANLLVCTLARPAPRSFARE